MEEVKDAEKVISETHSILSFYIFLSPQTSKIKPCGVASPQS
jgi:hypothetical protein